jgi:hypothetical protein
MIRGQATSPYLITVFGRGDSTTNAFILFEHDDLVATFLELFGQP